MSHRKFRLLAAMASTLVFAAAACAQNAIRTWDGLTFDTDAFTLPIIHVAQGGTTALVRSDGRIYVQGPNGSSFAYGAAPSAPLGLTYTKVELRA